MTNNSLLTWVILFFLAALIFGMLGFYGLESDSAEIAKLLFAVFIIFFIISALFGATRSSSSRWYGRRYPYNNYGYGYGYGYPYNNCLDCPGVY